MESEVRGNFQKRAVKNESKWGKYDEVLLRGITCSYPRWLIPTRLRCHDLRCNVNCDASIWYLRWHDCPSNFFVHFLVVNKMKKKKSEIASFTKTHSHTVLNNTEAVRANKMILGSRYCSLGTPHWGRARKVLRAALGARTVISTHTQYTRTHRHTHTSRHG